MSEAASAEADGTRAVGLFVPVEHNGRKITRLIFAPVSFDHLLRWEANLIDSAFTLMGELASVEVSAIRMITFPDADRVMTEFLMHVPSAIRDDIAKRRKPLAPPLVLPSAEEEPHAEEQGMGFALEDK